MDQAHGPFIQFGKTIPCPAADPGFSRGGVRQLPKVLLFFKFFAENSMKKEEFGPPGARPLHPGIRQCCQ